MGRKWVSSWVLFAVAAILAATEAVSFGADDDASRPRSRFRSGPAVHGSGERRVREEGRTVIYKKKTEVDFDDSLIEGEVKNPSEFYTVHRPEQKFNGLVKKRPNFHKEMLRDSVLIR